MRRVQRAGRAAVLALAPALFAASAAAQGGSCVNGFAGNTTIAGGWTAFETASGRTLTVLVCGCSDFDDLSSIDVPGKG